MEQSISTYIWPGQVHFGYGAVERVAGEAKAYCGNNVFIITDPGVAAAGLVESVTAPLRAAELSFEVYDQVIPDLADGAFHDPNWTSNPRSVTRADLEQLYLKAY